VIYKGNSADLIHWCYNNKPDLVLIEVAGPVTYGTQKTLVGKTAWMVYNAMTAGALVTALEGVVEVKTLVAPSSAWTLGYPEKVRHEMARCTAPNHDLRECECMIEMYHRTPSPWKPMDTYLEEVANTCKRRAKN
jgi:hypothetical protein